MRQLNSISTYSIATQKGYYLVSIKHLKNDYYGNPRYEAHVTPLTNFVSDDSSTCYYNTQVYRFRGHFYNEKDECVWLINFIENER